MGAPAESMLMADLNQFCYPVVAVIIAVVAVVVALCLRQGTPKECKGDFDKGSPLAGEPQTEERESNVEERKKDFEKEIPPVSSSEPSEKLDEQKELAELARSNPEEYMKYLMTHLDELNGNNIDSTVESIFKEFDEDGSGVLEGEEYDKCVQKLAEHMLGEYDEHMEKQFEKMSGELGMSKEEIDVIRSEHKETMTIEKLKKEVIKLVDVDGDGKITLQEAMDGFHKVVDAIE